MSEEQNVLIFQYIKEKLNLKDMTQIKKLKKEFIGRGEVKGFHFKQLYEHPKFYIYMVTLDTDKPVVHYELIKKIVGCKQDQKYEIYPGSKSFGIHGWTKPTIEGVIKSVKEHFNVDIERNGLDI